MEESRERVEAKGERFGRTRKATAPEVLELLRARERPPPLYVASYYCQGLIHRAHVVMLTERDILTGGEGAAILRGLREVEEAAAGDEGLVSYMATEAALIERVGDVGGKMHIGRSRNDLAQTQRRMYYRDRIVDLMGAVTDYRRALLRKAEENADAVMPGYTHLRQAQPITLGHYLLSHVDAAGRSLERLGGVYRRTNLSPLGAAALAGTGWPIDRRRTAELLGFDGLCENTIDGVAAHDYVVELASAVAIHMIDLSRLAEDLQLWSSDEFAMVDLDEAYAGTSSIMPQKKNPSSLEAVKLFAAEALGSLVAAASSVKGVPYTHVGDRWVPEPVHLDTAVGCTRVMAGVVSTLTPFREAMLRRASEGFTTMTEVADTLVRRCGVSFRRAHEIVAAATTRLTSAGARADQITVEAIREAARESLGRPLEVPEEELRLATDPKENVSRRRVVGGPSPDEVRRMIAERWRAVDADGAENLERRRKIEAAYGELKKSEEKILRAK